jgi:iron only hydrogenase large subunit-like protein
MQNCPTQAIRIVDGKAKITEEKCIDCGECIKVCPFHAKTANTDTLEILKEYKYTIAIPSLSLFGQFKNKFNKDEILENIIKVGFNEVYDSSLYADILSAHLWDLVCKEDFIKKPIISTFCPAVTRLIQQKYPSLISNLIRLESPMEISARDAIKNVMKNHNLKREDIGLFFIAQCPAKVTSIKEPLGLETSALDGAISIKEIYPIMMRNFDKLHKPIVNSGSGCNGLKWARPHGQAQAAQIGDYISVDGISEVSKILDMVETGIMTDINFIDAFACVGGCLGGPLNVENPFIARYRLDKMCSTCEPIDREIYLKIDRESLCWNKEISENITDVIDNDISKAMQKMMLIEELVKQLPGKDCGACGSPNCRALAQDTVKGLAAITDCVFLKKGDL